MERGAIDRFRLTQAARARRWRSSSGDAGLGGQVIWATRLRRDDEAPIRAAGKGAPLQPRTTDLFLIR